MFIKIISITGFLMASSIPEYFEENLSNGLRAVVVPLKNGSGVVSTDIFYRVGSRNEVMGKSGIAHMLEHLNFKSTKNLQAGEFDKIVKGFGGVNNASTSFDLTHYFIKSSTENMEKSLNLFAELMQNLSLTNSEFQPERDVVLEERYWRTDNSPFGLLYFTLFNTAFVYHPYHWTPIGFVEDIKNWKLLDIRNFHKKFYQPQNATIVIAGDVEPEEAFTSIKKEFEGIENRTKSSIQEHHFVEPEQFGEKRVTIQKESEVEYIALAFRIPNYQHEDQAVLSVISEILSSGKSSRLHKNLVVKQKLVNQIYAYNMESIDENLFMFMAVANKGVKAEDVEEAIWSEIETLKSEKVSKKELKKIKTNVRSEFIYGFEGASETANLFGSYFARGDLTPLLNFEDRVESMKPKDILEVANRYFSKNRATVVIYKSDK
jgi:predicted Zn-dependent peptidase